MMLSGRAAAQNGGDCSRFFAPPFQFLTVSNVTCVW